MKPPSTSPEGTCWEVAEFSFGEVSYLVAILSSHFPRRFNHQCLLLYWDSPPSRSHFQWFYGTPVYLHGDSTTLYSGCHRAVGERGYSLQELTWKFSGPKFNQGHLWEMLHSTSPATSDDSAAAIDTARGMYHNTLTSHWQPHTQHGKMVQILQCTQESQYPILKTGFFIQATCHMDTSVFCPVVLKANFQIKFLLYCQVFLFCTYCSLFPYFYILLNLLQKNLLYIIS